MKTAKRTPVPLPGAKAKSKAGEVPAKAPLSQEYIDSEDDDPRENAIQHANAKTSTTNIGIHTSTGTVKPKPKAGKSQTQTPSVAPPKAHPKKLSAKHTTTHEQVDSLSSSGQGDDDDAPAELPAHIGDDNEARAFDSDSESSSETSSVETSVGDAPQSSRSTVPENSRHARPTPHAVAFQGAQAYSPPQGFTAMPLNDKALPKATNIFGSLQGKQVWHITAPTGISLLDLTEMVMAQALDGEAVLSHRGTDYAFTQAQTGEDGVCAVLVARKDGYRTVPAGISRTLHLQEVVQLPNLSPKQADQNTGSEAAASITRSTIRAPRPQVTGLKMRFLPTGFGGKDAGVLGESDDETEARQGTAGLGVPGQLNLPSKKEKRKHAEAIGADATTGSMKKSKRHGTLEYLQKKEARRARNEKKRARDAASAQP
ncbi:hypothetical protein ACN47E_007078 [Coniothyrium glycines]